MKKILYIFLFTCVSCSLYAQDSTSTNLDSLYKGRLQYLPFQIEMPYNQVVGSYIDRYLNNKQQTARILARGNYYFPIFWDILGKYDLPYELCYLPVIESALNPIAHSPVGAAGLWQFMPTTGMLYGLEVNSLVDERMDPIAATEAACKFLKNLNADFGDWNLAIAAYNCGPGNVKKAIARSGGKTDFWSIYPYLPRETRSYLPIFIAACYVMNYADLHGICPDTVWMYPATDTLVIRRRLHFNQLTEVMGISLDTIRKLNPQYPKDIIPGDILSDEKSYTLCLPTDFVISYIENADSIHLYKADSLINNRRSEIELLHKQPIGSTTYTVKSGDNLGKIAKKYHVTVKQLKAWNKLKSDNIRIGQKLKICR